MAIYLWVTDGQVHGVGRTPDEAARAGVAVLVESTRLVIDATPSAAAFFNVDAAVARGRTVEYAYVGGAWPFPGIDPNELIFGALTRGADEQRPTMVVAAPAPTAPAPAAAAPPAPPAQQVAALAPAPAMEPQTPIAVPATAPSPFAPQPVAYQPPQPQPFPQTNALATMHVQPAIAAASMPAPIIVAQPASQNGTTASVVANEPTEVGASAGGG